MEQNEVANSVGRRRSDEAGNAPRFGVSGCDAAPPPRPSGTFLCLYSRGARGSLAAVWSCAPTTHLAACYPVCCHPRPSPWAARPPAQNRKGKEVISIVSGSPEKLPSSEWAGGIPGAGDQIKAGPARAAPTAPGARLPSPCVISLIQQNTCSAVATLQAAGELWGAPGPAPGCPQARRADGGAGGRGSGRARAHGPLPIPPPAVDSARGQESSPCWSHPPRAFPACCSRQPHEGLPCTWAGGQRFADEGTAPQGTRIPPGPPTRSGAWVCLPSRDPGVPVSPDLSKPTLGRAGLLATLGVCSPGAHLSLSTQELVSCWMLETEC